MTPPAASPESDGGTAYGVPVSSLQTGIVIKGGKISGTLPYVPSFPGFSSDASEQEGNFLALKVSGPDGATLYHELIGAEKTPGKRKFEGDDRQLVVRVTNTETQKIKLTAEKGAQSSEVTYDLSGLTLGERG